MAISPRSALFATMKVQPEPKWSLRCRNLSNRATRFTCCFSSPASPLSEALREHGLTWVLWEVGAIIVFGLASMGLDRVRRWQNERAAATIAPNGDSPAPSAPTAPE